MRIIRKQNLENQSISIDGGHFIDCVISRCEVSYSGGDFWLEDTSVRDCTWRFRGCAAVTANLLKALGWIPPATAQNVRLNSSGYLQ
jgi:hypothetical protein